MRPVILASCRGPGKHREKHEIELCRALEQLGRIANMLATKDLEGHVIEVFDSKIYET